MEIKAGKFYVIHNELALDQLPDGKHIGQRGGRTVVEFDDRQTAEKNYEIVQKHVATALFQGTTYLKGNMLGASDF